MNDRAITIRNPILKGEFADPDLHRFGGKYYIYPTTDGVDGWGGWQFHCFSSDDLSDWRDEGIILDVKNDFCDGKDNENGAPGVPWAVGNAWAPTIGECGGKYWFYFCAKRPDGVSCIGAAVADSPTGPFRSTAEPVITPEIVSQEIGNVRGQTIDPWYYEEDGRHYLLFGNGYGAIAELDPTKTRIISGSMHRYRGTYDLRESLIVVKRGGLYHFTWSCDDTGSENYHVNYGTSRTLYGDIEYRGTILEKRPASGILGTGHHSILHIPESDEYLICYHRFATPIGKYTRGFGFHRETCLDRLFFDADGFIAPIAPTNSFSLAL